LHCALAAALLGGCAPLAPRSVNEASARPSALDPASLPFVRHADERFQSFQIGFSHLTGGETWKSYDDLPSDGRPPEGGFQAIREARQPKDLSNPRLRALTAALAPLYIRYSGTTANSVYFQDNNEPASKPPEGFTVVLTRKAWKGAIDFARAVDAKILTSFTNSEGVRDADHAWTPRMAAPWMAYTKSIGGEIYAAELFNEPNAPEPPRIPRGHSAEEFARDFARFRTFLAPLAPSIKVAGPGTATMGVGGIPSIEAYTPEMYAAATPKPGFDIFSYHYYPALADRCAPPGSPQGIAIDQALTPQWLARPDAQFQRQKAVRDRFAPGAPIWLTETGGAACGGLRWQPTFLDMFRYLDTQGRLIRQGLDAIFTHALISGSNGIIDEKTYEPNASYWGAVLWSRLMGNRVLDAGPQRPGLNLYAHCQRGVRGGVTLLAINYGEAAADLPLTGKPQLYLLTAPELQSRTVLLNGQPLSVGGDNRLPAMEPLPARSGMASLPGRSIAFITVADARHPQCRN
jgi:hypothetical protein